MKNNAWQPAWFPIPPVGDRRLVESSHLDLFIATSDGRVLSTFLDNNAWLGSWFPI